MQSRLLISTASLLLWFFSVAASAVEWVVYDGSTTNPTFTHSVGDQPNADAACLAITNNQAACNATGSDSYGPWGRVSPFFTDLNSSSTYVFLRRAEYINVTPENDYCAQNPTEQMCLPQCEENYTNDPVTGECVCADGATCDDEDPVEPDACSDNDSCITEADQLCSDSGASLMNFQYFGNGQYGYQCGYQTNDNCPAGTTWNIPNQICIADSDSDGTPDPYDPEPENPNETGDADSDGIPDSQDSDPNDPAVWNNHGANYINVTATPSVPVTPIGESSSFNDTAIVSGLNSVSENQNITNKKLEELKDIGITTNDGIGALGTTLENGFSDLSSKLEPVDGDATINSVVELVSQSPAEAGITLPDESSGDFVKTAFGVFATSQCVNPNFGGHVLDLCSLASRVNPLAEFCLWLLTISYCWFQLHAGLGGSRGR